MILSNRIRRTFFVLSSLFFLISLSGCAGLGGGAGGPGAGLMDGGAGGLANLGANDVAAWDIWFETNGQRNSQPAVAEPGNLVLTVINSFPRTVTINVRWFEDNVLRLQRDYDIPIGESPVSADHVFNADGDHTVIAMITLVDPAVAEEPGNNQVSAVINAQAVGAAGGGGGGGQVQGVDLTWSDIVIEDAAGNVIREPVVGQPVVIYSESSNIGSVAAQNITRVFAISGEENYICTDPAAQSLDVGQSIRLSANYTFTREGTHTLDFKMSGFSPQRVANPRGANPRTMVINVSPVGTNPQSGGGRAGNLGDNDLVALGMHFETDGQLDDQPVIGVPGEVVLDLFNGFSQPTNIAVHWSENNEPFSEGATYTIPPGGTFIPIGHTFNTEGDRMVAATIALQDPGVAEDPGNNQASMLIHVHGVIDTQPQAVDLDWTRFAIKDAAGNAVPEPVVGQPVVISADGSNRGTMAAQNITRVFMVRGAEDYTYTDPVPQSLAPNGNQHTSFSRDYTFTTEGSHVVTFKMTGFHPRRVVDPQGRNPVSTSVTVLPAGSGGSGIPPNFRPIRLPRLAGTVTTVPPTLPMTSTAGPECELVAENIALWISGPDREVGHVAVGQHGWVSYTVKNKKGTVVNDVHSEVRFLLNGQLVQTIPAKLNVPANGQATGKSDFTPFTTPGIYKMALVVDPLKQKKDNHRNNNTLTRSIRVEAAREPRVAPSAGTDTGRTVVMAPECELVAEGVEFWVHGVDHPVTRVMVGQRGWVRYTVKNKKGKAVDNVYNEVRFLLNGQVMQTVPADLSIPSQGQKTGKNDVAPFTTPGMYKMALMVDPSNAKKDNHRGDNVLTRSLQVDAYRQYNPSNDSKSSGTLVDVWPGLLDTFTGGKGPKKPSGYTPPPSPPAPQTPPPEKPAEKSPRKFTTSYQS